jgi:hypothetical protein
MLCLPLMTCNNHAALDKCIWSVTRDSSKRVIF